MKRKSRTKKSKKMHMGRGDRSLFLAIMGLIIFGAVMIFSGSVPIATSQGVAPYYYFLRQIEFIIIGLVVFLITYNFDYHNYPKVAIPGLVISLILLVVVLFTHKINNTHRWLDIGLLTIQVSDITKLSMIIYLASWLSKPIPKEFVNAKLNKETITRFLSTQLIPFLLILSIFSGLIILQPDLSTTVLIGVTSVAMYYLSSNNILHTIGTMAIFATLGVAGIFAGIAAPYRFSRISSFFEFFRKGIDGLKEPFGRDYQLRQILIAVGTGGLTGQGFAQSKQKFSYLTETGFSDAIFAVFSEEMGFIGSLTLVSLFLWIMFSGFKISINANDKLGALLAAGITIWITLQAFMHIAVNVGFMPLTGIPLPFVSYGGSSLIMSMAAIGVLLNVSRFSNAYNI